MTRDETLLAKRFVDLSRQAQQKDIVVFSEFLNLNELNIFRQEASELYSDFKFYGGYESSERQMIAFLPDALCYTWNFPISCLKITPLNKKFAEKLNHRDVLGSLMNLGIERSKLGDILLEESTIYVFCHENIAEYIIEQLTCIRHTAVQTEQTLPDAINFQFQKETLEGIITSNRLDSVIACICKISRSQANQWISSGRVFINHKEILQITYQCHPQELISVRSFGRFRFLDCIGETRKGRLKIQYERYL
ncbi:MAG: hypothetical protein HFH41_11155 [Lachnospiraceae bacterium]|nr:hypothetical protein [Lachnospiraceae bacterium]